MPLGLNAKMRVWRMDNSPVDDDVGGAVVTGSVVYDCLACRLTPQRASLMLLQQGLETERMALVFTHPSTLLIYERDEIEMVGPSNSPYYGMRWRVIDVERWGLHPSDPRASITLTVRRIDRSRAVQ
jgi:hypothetical protein